MAARMACLHHPSTITCHSSLAIPRCGMQVCPWNKLVAAAPNNLVHASGLPILLQKASSRVAAALAQHRMPPDTGTTVSTTLAAVGDHPSTQQHAVPSVELLEAQQLNWAQQVDQVDTFKPDEISRVGGLDVHWVDSMKGIAGLVVLSWPQLQQLHAAFLEFTPSLPYQTGLLGFRECPAYLQLLETLQGTPYYPQLLFVDGCGVLHPRGAGSASQLGLQACLPAIGVSKSLNSRAALTDRQVKQEMQDKGLTELPLYDADGAQVGCAIRKDTDHKQPVYVSVGHGVCLDTAVVLARSASLYRIPEPIRLADIATRHQALGLIGQQKMP